MYCYHPLKGFYLGDKSNGKRKFKVTSYDVDHLELINGNWTKIYDDSMPTEKFGSRNYRPAVRKYIDIPCGQCIGCRLQRSREWANRLMMELQSHEKAIFLTLTYNNDNLRYMEGVNPLTGEITKTPGLVLEDLQKFIKDLRNHNRDIKIRYFACGEYGDESMRPHYHLIVFGYEPSDLQFYKHSQGFDYFTSKEIESIWPYGFNVIAQVTWESCAYTARYVVKKMTGEAGEVYKELGIKPPFVIMSTRPGIAHDYYIQNRDKFRDDQMYYYLSTKNGSVSFTKPRYFKKLDDINCFVPDDIQTLVYMSNEHADEIMKIAEDQEMQKKIMLIDTSLSFLEALQASEDNKKAQIKQLKRKEF